MGVSVLQHCEVLAILVGTRYEGLEVLNTIPLHIPFSLLDGSRLHSLYLKQELGQPCSPLERHGLCLQLLLRPLQLLSYLTSLGLQVQQLLFDLSLL